jgi:hypothetical protein
MTDLWILGAFAFLFWLLAAVPTSSADGAPTAGRLPPPAHEVAAAIGLALLVPVMMLVSWIATGRHYMPRYAIGTAMGVAILIGFAAIGLGKPRRHGEAAAMACILLVAAGAGVGRGRELIERFAQPPPQFISSDLKTVSTLNAVPGDEPIAIGSAFAFFTLWWYSPPETRERLHYLSDMQFALTRADFIPELSLVANQPFVPEKVDDYRQFTATHRKFLLYCVGVDDINPTKGHLQHDGWTIVLLQSSGEEAMYQVTAPDR